MIVRRAHTADAAPLLALVARYWAFEGLPGFEPGAVQGALERLLSSPGIGAVWVAERPDEPVRWVGYLSLVYVFSLEHRGMTAEIDEFFVLPDQRALGFGSRLLRQAELESVRQGCTNISLQVARSNHHARAFYARRGYAARPAFELLEKSLGVS